MFLFSDDPLFTDEELFLMCAASGGKTVQDTATGNPLTFITDVSKPLKSLLIPFTPQQEGTGDPSPQNIRSILPWNGLKVFGGGKNLLNPANRVVAGNNAQYYRSMDRFLLKGGQTYTLSANVTPSKLTMFKGTNTPVATTTSATLTHTPAEDVEVWFDIYVTNSRLPEGGISAVYGMLEVGETATAYEPYHPITETDISFPSPVYGGILSVVSGVLRVEWKIIDLHEQSWSIADTSNYRMFYATIPEMKVDNASLLCTDYKYANSIENNNTIRKYTTTYGAKRIAIHDDRYNESGTSVFKNAMEGVYVAIELETPQTVTLTPTQLTALLGDNTIWSDADGSMTAVYLKKG